jgi:hypothetical protein
MRAKLVFVAMCLLLTGSACAAALAEEGPDVNAAGKPYFTVGFEMDLLPYLAGGGYGSVYAGFDGWRVRGVINSFNMPDFVTPDGFEDWEVNAAYALIVDRFFGKQGWDFRGFWAGTGFEYWDNQVRPENVSASTRFDSWYFTLGGGYAWKLVENLYLMPWGAVHLRVAGDDDVDVSGENFQPPFFSAEVSLKIGYHFGARERK